MSGSDRLSDRGLAASWRVSGLIVIKWRGSLSVEVRPGEFGSSLDFPGGVFGFLASDLSRFALLDDFDDLLLATFDLAPH